MENQKVRRYSDLTLNRTRADVEKMSRVYGDPTKAAYAVVGIEGDSIIIQDKMTGITAKFSREVIETGKYIGVGEIQMGIVGNHEGYKLPYTVSGGLSKVLSGASLPSRLLIAADAFVEGLSFDGDSVTMNVCSAECFSDVFYDKFVAYAIEIARFCCSDESCKFDFVEFSKLKSSDLPQYGFDSDEVWSFYAEFSCSSGSFCVEYFIAFAREVNLRAYAALSIRNVDGTPIVENEYVDMEAKYAATEARAYARLAVLCVEALGADIDIDNPAYFYLFD